MSDLLNSASLVMIPSGYKEDIVYSEIPTNGNGDLSFTRASNGTRVNSAGLVEDVPWNLAEQSNTFSNAIWGLSDATVTGSQSGYDGTNNAWKLQSSGGTGTYIVQGSFSTIRTQSIYAKAGTTSKFSIIVGGYGNGMQFDLSNGTIVTNSNSSYFSGSITSVGNGWYYIVVTIQAIAPTYGYLVAPQNLGGGGISVGDYVFIQNSQVNLGTAKPYFPTTDRLNVPRLTYQNGGGGCPSLLLEKQSTNLVLYSEQLDNAAWTKTNVTITANDTTSPDGTQNADKITLDSSTNSKFLEQSESQNGTYTQSVYAKAGTHNFLQLLVGTDPTPYCNFDLINGTYSASGCTASITSVGNGWFRCVMTYTTTVGDTLYLFAVNSLSSSRASSTSSTGYYYIWGFQVEASSYPTSYIPTTSSSATRVADACFKTGISSLIGQTSGTLFADFKVDNANPSARIISVSDGTFANRIVLLEDGLFIRVYVATASVVQTDISFGTWIGRHKIALAYANNDLVVFLDGVLVATDTSISVPTCSAAQVGTFENNTDATPLQGTVNQAVIFPTRLTNAELASLTTI